MSTKWTFHHEVPAELIEASEWYESARENLGADFATAIDGMLARLRDGSMPHLPVACEEEELRGRVWRVLLSRFPYAIVFVKVDEEHFQSVAIAHLHRRPNYWRSRAAP